MMIDSLGKDSIVRDGDTIIYLSDAEEFRAFAEFCTLHGFLIRTYRPIDHAIIIKTPLSRDQVFRLGYFFRNYKPKTI